MKNPFESIQIETPQEVIKRLRGDVNARKSSGNPEVRRWALFEDNLRMAVEGFKGEPEEVRRAREVQYRLRNVDKSVAGIEDPAEREIRKMQVLRDIFVDAGDVEKASQFNTQLLAMMEAKTERAYLSQRREREDVTWDQEQKARTAAEEEKNLQKMLANNFYVVDKNQNLIEAVSEPTMEESIAKAMKIRQENPGTVVVTREEFVRMTDQEKAALQDAKIVQSRDFSRKAVGMVTFATGLEPMISALEKNPHVATDVNAVQAIINDVGANVRAFVEMNTRLAGDDVNAVIDRALRQQWAMQAGVDRSVFNAQMINAAFALASSREGGKLSESDIQYAYETMGANLKNPIAILQNFRTNLEMRMQEFALLPTVMGLEAKEDVQKSKNATLKVMQEKLNRIDAALAAYTGSGAGAAPGAPSAASIVEQHMPAGGQ